MHQRRDRIGTAVLLISMKLELSPARATQSLSDWRKSLHTSKNLKRKELLLVQVSLHGLLASCMMSHLMLGSLGAISVL